MYDITPMSPDPCHGHYCDDGGGIDIRKTMTSSVNGGGEAPFQVFPPVQFSGNTTVDSSYTPEVGWGDINPLEPEGDGSPAIQRRREETPSVTPHGQQKLKTVFKLHMSQLKVALGDPKNAHC
jgi:hypothetical protein